MSTILQIANADRNLHLLIQGLRVADLNEKLQGTGPFTLLAPVDLAFRNLSSPDSFENLLNKPAMMQRLIDILSYHILAGKKMIRDFRDGQRFKTALGGDVIVAVKNGVVHINGARILARDMQGSNGVVHTIDSVNIPG